MKQLRLALALTAVCVALGTAFVPAYADVVDFFDVQVVKLEQGPGVFPDSNAVLLPDSGATVFFFDATVQNKSPYVLNFDYVYDPAQFMQVSGISVPLLYDAQGLADPPLFLMTSSLNGCGDGISLLCLHPGETFSGPVAYGFVGAGTLPGSYGFTEAGLGYPATMSFQATYTVNEQRYSTNTESSPAILVNVVAQNAVPEAHPWVLLMAGLASVLLISSRRIRG